MSEEGQKTGSRIILPVLLVPGIVSGLVLFILNIQPYLESSGTKVSCPATYEFRIFDRLLKRHVRNGLVDYAAIKGDPELNYCCVELEHCSPEQLQGKLARLSFWINAYNLLTIKGIADSYPASSCRSESLNREFIVGGRSYSLKKIREEVLPPLISTSDWRAVFLLCNGSAGAPAIACHAYSASRIGEEFEPAMKRFVLLSNNYSFDEKKRVFSISPFYRENLRYIDRIYPSAFDMVAACLPPERKIDLAGVSCNYALPYDRRLNDSAPGSRPEMENAGISSGGQASGCSSR